MAEATLIAQRPVAFEAPAAHVVQMPGWRAIASRVSRTVLIVSVLPMAIFYAAMVLGNVGWAVGTTLGWYYAGIVVQLIRRRPVLGAAALGAGLLTLRAAVMMCTGSAFIYFLQPIIGTTATAIVFAGSALASKPLLDRMTHDFCPLPEAVSVRLRAAGFFRYLSLLWAVVYAINAAGTLWLLTHASLAGFLMLKTVVSPCLTGSAVLVSYLLFRLLMRREGVSVRWGAGTATPAGAELIALPIAAPVRSRALAHRTTPRSRPFANWGMGDPAA